MRHHSGRGRQSNQAAETGKSSGSRRRCERDSEVRRPRDDTLAVDAIQHALRRGARTAGLDERARRPVYKDGDKHIDNYRGITLLSVVGKLYTVILNTRLSQWCERNQILVDEQA